MVDTGATVSIIKPQIYRQICIDDRPTLKPCQMGVMTADGRSIASEGRGSFQLVMGGKSVQHDLYVATVEPDGILGLDFLNKHVQLLDFKA